jgi:hypothetical protein
LSEINRLRCPILAVYEIADSSFGMLAGSGARGAEAARVGEFRPVEVRRDVFSKALRRWHGGADSELNGYGAKGEGRNI